ncbi:MAG: tRNA uridine(34) 5-carboxymethylaminomethyl modification radical SAM/GNAT enzyme Elp3 [Thermoplasmata archaeon]
MPRMDKMEIHEAAVEILNLFKEGKIKNKEDLQKQKIRVSKEKRIPVIRNSSILELMSKEDSKFFLDILQIKPSRTQSGVSPVAIMTSPHPCPHGVCIYCPGGMGNNSPQSYTGHEPAALRGAQNNYDPYKQVISRLKTLEETGHSIDKIDMIIMGGTFPARNPLYQKWFVKRAFDAVNGVDSPTIESALLYNETAKKRVIGLTVETRPDQFNSEQRALALSYGTTRVELGVQCLDDMVLDHVNRKHTVQDVINVTKGIKNDGFKVIYHIMPGLPGMNPEKDLENFKRLFEDESFRPDMLKIYPTLVVKGTKLYEMWSKGEYKPYNTEEASDLISRMKEIVPPYVRIQRIQRDIPVKMIVDGVKASNLREIAQQKLKERGKKCNCIRCREAVRNNKSNDKLKLNIMNYEASQGTEYFISMDSEDNMIYGYLRLRYIPKENKAIIREVKVLGNEVPISVMPSTKNEVQHRGIGKTMISEAEEIAKSMGTKEIYVLSGVGVREYFMKLGFEKKLPYLAKKLI